MVLFLNNLTSDMKTMFSRLIEQKILIVSERKLYHEKQHFCRYK